MNVQAILAALGVIFLLSLCSSSALVFIPNPEADEEEELGVAPDS